MVHFPFAALAGALLSGGVRIAASPISIAIVAGLTLTSAAVGWLFSELTERNTGKAGAFLHRRIG